ncbi:MAG: PEP-CTERM sorting domain-containing protein [Verrucomicrobiota bacterium]|nr:PEP-CTERM sorting domain-containing protein [Verrucomicrobiota bacterium]
MQPINLIFICGLLATGATQLHAQSSLIAGWDFDVNATHWTTAVVDTDDDGYGNGSVQSNFTTANLVGTIYWNGSFGSTSGLDYLTATQVTTYEGTATINQSNASLPLDQEFSLDTVDPAALAFNHLDAAFVIAVPTKTAGGLFQSIVLTYAGMQQGTGAGAANTIGWSWSLTGQDFSTTVDTDTIAIGAYSKQTVDLSGITALNNQSMIYLRGTMAGAGAATVFDDLLAIDNIQINGVFVAVPEPAHYAAIAGLLLIGMAIVRRNRAS